MNKVFKVIWSKTKGCWVVTSELAKSHGKTKTNTSKIVISSLLAATTLVSLGSETVDASKTTAPTQLWSITANTSSVVGTKWTNQSGMVFGIDSTTWVNGDENTVAIGRNTNATGGASVAIGGGKADANGGTGAVALAYATATGAKATAMNDGSKAIGDSSFAAGGGTATGNSAVAIGYNTASGTGTVSIGNSTTASSQGSVALGNLTTATGVGAVAIGDHNNATTIAAVALGMNANATGANAIAITGGTASGRNSVAFGGSSKATNESAIAFGAGAQATGDYAVATAGASALANNTVALGNTSKAAAENTVAIGGGANASQTNAVAVGASTAASGANSFAGGYGAKASGASAIAIGETAQAYNKYSIAIGMSTSSGGDNAIAIGTNAKAKSSAVAIGGGANANGLGGTAVGDTAQATANSTVAVGVGATASGLQGVAIGASAQATRNYATAIGTSASSIGISAFAGGYGSFADGTNAIAIGSTSYAKANAVAIGSETNATNTGSVAIGNKNTATQQGATALGFNVNATGVGSLAQGYETNAKDNYTTAIGMWATASTERTIAIGFSTTATARAATAVGDHAQATQSSAVAIGGNANASAANAIAIGNSATANQTNSIALGNGATTSAVVKTATMTVAGQNYNLAGTNPTGTLSLGTANNERTITNVAAGRVSGTSTDAINGSQLYAVTQGVSTVAASASTAQVSANAAQTAANTAQTAANTAQTTANNVSTTVAKGINFYGAAGVYGGSGVQSDVKTVQLGNGIFIQGGDNNVATDISGDRINIKINPNLQVSSVAITGTSIKVDNTGINAGSKGIQNLASGGTTDSNAANIGDVKKAVSTSASTINSTISTVSTSVSRQLSTTNSSIENLSTSVSTEISSVASTTSSSIENLSTSVSTEISSVVSTTNRSIESLSTGVSTEISSVESTTNSSIENLSTSVSTKISSVESTTNSSIENLSTSVSTVSTTVNSVSTAVATNSTNIATNTAKITSTASRVDTDGITFAGDTNNTGKKKLGDTVDIKGSNGNISTVANANGINIGLNPTLTGMTSITMTGGTVFDNGGITFSNGTSLTNDGLTINGGPKVVSAGIDAGNKTITNVADGTIAAGSKEAVNGGQLHTVSTGMSTALASTNSSISTVSTTVNSVSTAVATNSTNIAKNTGDIANNTANIATNTANITKNTGDIATNTAKITSTAGTADSTADRVNTDGITFAGDTNDTGKKMLGDTVDIKGSNGNISTVANANGINIGLNPTLTGISSITMTGGTVFNNDGVDFGNGTKLTNTGLTAGNVSVTTAGINAGSQKITNVADGQAASDAVNKGQLDKVQADQKISKVEDGVNTTVSSSVSADGKTTTYKVNVDKATVSADTGLSVSTTPNTANSTTDYKVSLSQDTKDSLAKADSAVQSFKVTANTTNVTTIDQTNSTLDFVDGNNIAITNDGGKVKVSTKDDVTFSTVTAKEANVSTANISTVVASTVSTGNTKMDTNGITLSSAAGNTVLNNGGLTFANGTTLNDGGLTINGGPTITKTNVDMANQTITNVGTGGTTRTNAANIGDVQDAVAKVNREVTVAAGTNVANVDSTVNSTATGVSTIYTVNANGAKVTTPGTDLTVTASTEANNMTNYVVDLSDAMKSTIASTVASTTANTNKLTSTASTADSTASTADSTATRVNTDGITFVADDASNTGKKKLGDSVDIKGANTNISTVANASGITIGLNPTLTGMTSITMTGGTVFNNDGVNFGNGTKLTNTGLTAGSVSLTTSGIDAGNTKITNVADGQAASDAVNKGQLDKVQADQKISKVEDGVNTTVSSSVSADGKTTTYKVNVDKATVSADTGLSVSTTPNTANSTTDYKVSLSQDTKDSLAKADSAMQSFKVTANAANVTTIDQANSSLDFVDGDNIAITNDSGKVKVSTKQDVTFSTVNTKVANVSTANISTVVASTVSTGDTKMDTNGITLSSAAGNTVLNNGGLTFANGTTVTDGGLTIAGGPTITKSNVDMAGNTITNVGTGGTTRTNAANIGDVQDAVAKVNREVTVAAGTNVANIDSTVNSTATGVSTTYTVNANGAKVTTSGTDLKVTPSTEANNMTNYVVDLSDAMKSTIASTVASTTANTTKLESTASTADSTADRVNTDGITFAGDTNDTGKKMLGDTVDIKGSNGNISTVANANGINIGLNPTLTGMTSITMTGGTVFNNDGVDFGNGTKLTNTGLTAGNVSVTTAGINAGSQKITNVADGQAASDAVNKGQLDKVQADQKISKVEDGVNTTVSSSVSADGKTTTYKVNVDKAIVSADTGLSVSTTPNTANSTTDYKVSLSQDTKDSLAKADSAVQSFKVNANTTNVTTIDQANSSLDFVDGNNIAITNDGGKVKVSTKDDVTFSTVTAKEANVSTANISTVVASTVSTGNTKMDTNGITLSSAAGNTVLNNGGLTFANGTTLTDGGLTITGGPTITKTNVDMGNNQIHHVAAGSAPTDAVNYSQLSTAIANQKVTNLAEGKNVSISSASSTAADGITTTTYTVNAKDTTITKGTGLEVTSTWDSTTSTTNYVVGIDSTTSTSLGKADSAMQSFKTTVDGNDAQTLDQTNNKANFKTGNNIVLTPGADGITIATASSVNFGDVTTGNTKMDNGGITITGGANSTVSLTNTGLNNGGNQITNVASGGTNRNNAANIGDVQDAVASTVDKGLTFAGDTGTDVQRKLGEKVTVKGGKTADLTDNNIGVVADGSDTLTIKLAKNITALDSITMTGGTVFNNSGVTFSNGTNLTNDGLTINNGPKIVSAGIDAGSKKITNVADGDVSSTSKDAVNGSQLQTVKDQEKHLIANPNGGDYTVDGNNKVTLIVQDGKGNEEPVVIADVAKASDLNKLTSTVNSSTFGVTAGDGSSVSSQLNNTVSIVGDSDDNKSGNIKTKVDSGKVVVSLNDNVKVSTVTANTVTTGDTKMDTNGVTVGSTVSLTSTGLTAGDTKVTTDGLTINNGPTVTKSNVDMAGNQIHKVAAGTAGDDAVNVDQLNSTVKSSLANQGVTEVVAGTNIASVSSAVTSTADGTKLTTYTVNANGTTVSSASGFVDVTSSAETGNITKYTIDLSQSTKDLISTTVSSIASTGLTFKGDKGSTDTKILGNTVDIKGDDNISTVADPSSGIKIGINPNLTKMNSITMDGGTKLDNGGLTINNGPTITQSTVDMGGNQIHNVAAGTDPNDAVNVSQLQGLTAGVDNSLRKLGTQINKVGAGAAALAALHPLDFDPDDKVTFATGVGMYKGEKALALGGFYRPNENTMISMGTTIGNNDNMVNIGASFKVGSTDHLRKEIKEYKTAPISTVYVLEDRVSTLQSRNESLENENKNLRGDVEDLKAKVAMLMEKMGM